MYEIREGSIVVVKGGFGSESPKQVKVEGVGLKNGYQVFDYDGQSDGTGRWAYSDQILEVIEYWGGRMNEIRDGKIPCDICGRFEYERNLEFVEPDIFKCRFCEIEGEEW